MMYRILLLSLVISMIAVGCGVHPTESIQVNGAGITDGSRITLDALTGIRDGHTFEQPDMDRFVAVAAQTNRNAQTNEQILGSPKNRIQPGDTEAMEKNRVQAKADAEEGGFWAIFSVGSLQFLGVVAGFFGLGAVGTWLNKRAKQVRTVQKKLRDAENTAKKYAGQIKNVEHSAERFLNKLNDGDKDPSITKALDEI